MQDHERVRVGTLCHSYGHMFVKVENGVAYWGVCDGVGTYWEEIPNTLYGELINFNNTVRQLESTNGT